MVGLEKFAFDLVTGLVVGVIQQGTTYAGLSFFEHRRIKNRIDDAIAEVVEPLLPFLDGEGIPEEKQRRLIQTCIDELRPLTENPGHLFQGSLDGQIIFDELYADRELPEVVIEDELKDVYILLCPRIATILCKIPAAVKDWEHEAWSENYRRLDEIKVQLRFLFRTVDELATLPSQQADEVLSRVRRQLNQTVRFRMDVTDLRADKPLAGRFGDFFVHPEIIEEIEDKEEQSQLTEATDGDVTQLVHRVRQGVVVGTPNESLDQFVYRSQQSVVVAPAGAGKSTWAKWLQRETLSDRWTGISVLVKLRALSSESLPSLQDLIRETAGKHLAEELTGDRISHWLDTRQVVFILDGFDEIRPAERDKVYDWIVGLQSAARGCPFVLTSRPLTTDHLDRLGVNGWRGWVIEPFDEARIVDYMQRWYAHSPTLGDSARVVNAKMLAQSWRRDPTVKPLTGNPLLLSTLLMVHHLDGSLPSGRAQLYQRYVEGMLGLWDDRRGVAASGVQLSLEQKRRIIRGFALKLFFEEQDQLDELAILEWLQELLQEMRITSPANDVLDVLRERSGLIVGPGVYSFAHKSIAEYLVAETVLQGVQCDAAGNRIDRFRLFEHRDDDRWNIVLFLWAGLAPIADVESFIKRCIEVQNFPLVFGILADQYDRISQDICRKIFLQVIALEPFPEDEGSVGWASSCPSIIFEPLQFHVPTFLLRTLGSVLNFTSFVKIVIVDRIIVWSDCNDAKVEWRDILWWSFADWLDDVHEWKACLATPPPTNGSSIQWLYGAIEQVFAQVFIQETISIETAIKAYQDACPQYRGLVPIALISVGLELILNKHLQSNPARYEHITKLLEVLPDSDQGDVVEEWLWGTRDWVLGYGRHPKEHIGDLLVVFMEEMERLVQEDHIERNETYERAIQYVQELQRRRDALEVPEISSQSD